MPLSLANLAPLPNLPNGGRSNSSDLSRPSKESFVGGDGSLSSDLCRVTFHLSLADDSGGTVCDESLGGG